MDKKEYHIDTETVTVIKNKKTGEDNIVVPYEDFTIISSYLITTAACENELVTLGVSMLKH